VLKRGGFLTRDSRVVERKKYGRAKARRSFQFSKRLTLHQRVGKGALRRPPFYLLLIRGLYCRETRASREMR
jgi:hypothetical protein